VKGYEPSRQITEYEQTHMFLSFCSLVTLTSTKKLNLANVFIAVLKDKSMRDLFRKYCDFENNFGALKFFLQSDPSLHKSKYIMKFLNNNKNILENE